LDSNFAFITSHTLSEQIKQGDIIHDRKGLDSIGMKFHANHSSQFFSKT